MNCAYATSRARVGGNTVPKTSQSMASLTHGRTMVKPSQRPRVNALKYLHKMKEFTVPGVSGTPIIEPSSYCSVPGSNA